jgi:hypothetical protein
MSLSDNQQNKRLEFQITNDNHPINRDTKSHPEPFALLPCRSSSAFLWRFSMPSWSIRGYIWVNFLRFW